LPGWSRGLIAFAVLVLTDGSPLTVQPAALVLNSFDGSVAGFSLVRSSRRRGSPSSADSSDDSPAEPDADTSIADLLQTVNDSSRDTLTALHRYRIYVAGVSVLLLAQLFLIVLLLLQRRDRRRAEETVRARETALRSSYERIRQLAGRLIHAQETARAAVARDLHDETCQQLAAVALGVAALKRSAGQIADPAIQQAFSDLEYQTQVTFDGIRRLSHDLHPTSLRLLGLAPALKTHCLDVAERQRVPVAFAASGDFRKVPTDIAICLYRIAQEALRNAVVHGHAEKISVEIARSPDAVDLIVSDDGQGFDVDSMRRGTDGLGLVSMEERARIVGGAVEISSRDGHGTIVRVHCPSELEGVEVATVI
jgi:signal transduction histidine kinase